MEVDVTEEVVTKRRKPIPGTVRIEVRGIKVYEQAYKAKGHRAWHLNKALAKIESSSYTITFSPNITKEIEDLHCSEHDNALSDRAEW